MLNGELHLTPLFFLQCLDKLRLVDPPIYEANARVCSDHFMFHQYWRGLDHPREPSRQTLCRPFLLLILYQNVGSSAKSDRLRPSLEPWLKSCWRRWKWPAAVLLNHSNLQLW